jgi:ubiquinone/menaquinone biosynthesis C-methylase UbiE
MSITLALRRPLEAIEANLARPTGRLGTAVGHAMTVQHHTLTRWCHRHLDPPSTADVLDVGCGSGHALRLLSQRCTTGRLAGIDLSPTMVDLSRRTNAAAARNGRLDVRHGDAMELPFGSASFDVVTAIETLYFWPDPGRGLAECRRVLRPGGRLAVALEMTRDAAEDPTLLQRAFGRRFTARSAAEGLRILSGTELVSMFVDAGFVRVRFAVEPRRSLGWLCVVGRVQ